MNLSAYTVTIFQESGSNIDPYLCAIIVGSVRLVFAICASATLRFIPRRPLFLSAALSIGTSMFLLGTAAYLKKELGAPIGKGKTFIGGK